MSLKIYGIPNCGTCKKAIKWLQENNIDYEFINTKDNTPNQTTITSWVESLGSKPMRNTSGKSYRALGEAKKTWTDQQWIEAFSQDAMLLKRPLFVKDDRAILVGFRASETELKEKLL
ncbi:MAG: Spx/MgsR family RNA polymerase-binding regulatory protein [Pleurocapsa sp.]